MAMRVPAVVVAVGAGLLHALWALRPENKRLGSPDADVSQPNLSPCIGQPDPDQQLNGDVLKVMCERIQQSGANFLVFGLGRDSDFWYNNVNGKVLFLENHPDWLEFQTPRVREATRLVSYSTDIKDYRLVLHDQAKLGEFFDRLPSDVLNTRWDVILVDSPMGMEWYGQPTPGQPGRMQSVSAALKLAHSGTTVFVDDWQRQVERHSTDVLLAPHTQQRVVFDNGHGGKTAMFVVNHEPATHAVIASALVQEDLSPCRGQPDPKQQLNGNVLRVICDKIQQSDANFLVFGLGRDSDFWLNNVDGKVLFLENHPDWLDFQTPRVREATRLVSYSTDVKDFDLVLQDPEKLDELFNSLPSEVRNTRWDAILVDSPMGMEIHGRPEPGNPGRMQSVNAALKLARLGTVIFVDDWQRTVERASTDKLLAPHTDSRLVFDNGHGGLTSMFTVTPDHTSIASALVQQQDLSPCMGQPDPQQQLNGEVLKVICQTIQQSGANFLVFGLGRDSDFWFNNVNGKVRFLENHPDWLDFQTSRVRDATHLVSYTTVMEEYQLVLQDQAKLDEFYNTLPAEVLDTHWDAILVDSPMGMEGSPGQPGRMQSVSAALKLATPGTVVFVDDWQRQVERHSTDTLLSPHSTSRLVFDNGHGGLTAMFTIG